MDIKNLKEAQELSEELKDLEFAAEWIEHRGTIDVCKSYERTVFVSLNNGTLRDEITVAILNRIDVIKQRIEEL